MPLLPGTITIVYHVKNIIIYFYFYLFYKIYTDTISYKTILILRKVILNLAKTLFLIIIESQKIKEEIVLIFCNGYLKND